MSSTSKPYQLSLGVSLNDQATFDNFYHGADSTTTHVVESLKKLIAPNSDQAIYLWGPPGCGSTHLLQATCHFAHEQGIYSQYLPLREIAGFDPDALLEGMASYDVVCFDSLEAVIGNAQWDRALFNTFNELRDSGKSMVFSALSAPKQLQCSLPDLLSRLEWCVNFHMALLNDADKQHALQKRAKGRGIEMSDEVAQFILHRAPRDMNDLFYLLNRLDEASLQEQRKLTIPFVKQVLGF